MNFFSRDLSTQGTAPGFVASSENPHPGLVAKVPQRRYKHKGYAVLGLAVLLLSLLALPIAQRSSAHQGKQREVKRQEEKRKEGKTWTLMGAKASSSTPNAPLAPSNDTCAGAIGLQLRQSVDGTLDTATNDYQLSGAACFTGIGQFPSTAPGRDVVYSFTAPATASYSFRVTNFIGNYDYMIYTASTCPAGSPVTVATCLNASDRNANAGPSEEVMCQAMTAGQAVFIFVDEFSPDTVTDIFKIEVTQCQRETEANDTPATANPFIFGMEGTISPGTDADFFSLGLTIPGSRVFSLVDGSAGVDQTTDDFDLRVTTTTDTLEYDDDNADFAFGFFSAAMGGTPITGPATFLRISPFFAGSENEPYRVYAIVEPPGANPIAACGGQTTSALDELEPNDTLPQANPNPLGYFEGAISTSTDLDIFSFYASAGDLIYASLDLDPCRNNTPFDGDMFLLDAGSNTLVAAADGGNTSSTTSGAGSLTSTSPRSPGEGLTYRIQTSGTYYIGLQGFQGATGDYLLAISRNGNAATGPTAAPASISGSIATADGSPLAGVTVNLRGGRSAKTITDSNGDYRFNNVDTDNFYTVTPSIVNYQFSPAERSFSLLANMTDAAFTATRDAVIGASAIDTAEYFVRQHYLDFLGREPDESGFNFWSDQMLECGADSGCFERRRINVSAAYFLSIEFQQTGGLVDGLYRASYGRAPRYAEFMPDARTIAHDVVVGEPDWEQTLTANKQAFIESWVQRSAFREAYDDLSNDSYVDTLISHTGVSYAQSQRDALVSALASGGLSRAAVLLRIVDDERFKSAKRNESFVMMEYFGYLRRDPDESGFQFWLTKLNQFGGNFEQAEMVKAFIDSGEYRARFR